MRFLKQPVIIQYSPKNTMYISDGLGRDTYISNNNGGLGKSGHRLITSNEYPIIINDLKTSTR